MSQNATHCGWPERNFIYIYSQPGFKYTDSVLRPIWLLICTTGNIINIILLRKITTFQATFLVSVAAFDMIFMWSWFFAMYIRDRVGEYNIAGQAAWATLTSIEYFGNVAALCSDWTLLIFSLIRLLTVIDPFSSIWYTKTKIRILITCIIPLAGIAKIYQMVDYGTQDKPAQNSTWLKQWRDVEDIGTLAIPVGVFLAMLIINVLVLLILIKRRMLQPSATGGNVDLDKFTKFCLQLERKKGEVVVNFQQKETRAATTVRLLTASVVLFLICRIPFISWYILLILERHCLAHISDNDSVIFLIFYYQFLYINFSVNFLIYCGVSRIYLMRFLKLTASCRHPKAPEFRSRSTLETTLSENSPNAAENIERFDAGNTEKTIRLGRNGTVLAAEKRPNKQG
ncbi:uncharacterized protein LOC129580992 [Paramacrobiotus metropolitanus]|uniref:uncharacterized protein LOC129580992 n=1 Tax=Paramacrobiotus metropolitanus TaxID=2943436 RepID=UPI002445B202|nr:uncharacterized protein LOC129580992 [Paramacrobiotus metropolitanus]